MICILKEILDRHAPFVTKRIKGKKSPLMSKEIKRQMNVRDQLHRKLENLRKTQTDLFTSAKETLSKMKFNEPKRLFSAIN